MSMIDNTFENQSALEDENSGGAVADALGGSSAAPASSFGSKFSLDAAKASLFDALSKKPFGTLFKNGKFVFPTNLLKEFKLDSLIKGIQDALGKGLSISKALQNGINGMLGSLVSQLTSDANETWAFLQQAGGSFLQTLSDKAKGLLLSRIYVPDIIFLAGLEPLKLIHSNISYKNNYVRNLCIRHDMPLSLEFVDKELKIRYTMENTKGKRDAITAAKYGSFNVSFYIMDKLYDEIKELKACYPLPEKYDRDSQLVMKNKYEGIINEANSKLKVLKDIGAADLLLKPIDDKIKEYTEMLDELPINMEDKYKEDPNYEKIQTYIKKGMKDLCEIMKNVIVYSYSNLTGNMVMKALKKYKIDASVFGTSDKEYGQVAKITTGDVNIIAPFFTPKTSKSLIATANDVASKSTLIKDIAGKDEIEKQKFISPRNVNAKSIYIALASKNINEKYMVNKPYYERLKYPVYSDLLGAIDSALSGLANVGIGKTLIGALNSIEEAYYVYGKSMEPYLYDAAKVEYISFNDLTPLPAPDEEEKATSTSSSTKKGRADSKQNNSLANTNKGATGPTVPSELSDSKDDIIDSMSEDELNQACYTYGIAPSIAAAGQMTSEEKREKLKKYFKENDVGAYDLIDLMSDESIIAYLAKKEGKNISEYAGISRSELIRMMKKKLARISINYEYGPSKVNSDNLYVMLRDDMKRYLRKFFNYKEYDLMTKTDQGIAYLFNSKLFAEKRNIYYTYEYEICGYDAQGFPIIGYPDQETILKAISDGNSGTYSDYNKNGYPITSTGLICPIIGYNSKGKAMYGIPVFYPDSDPVGEESRGMPVFAYYRDTALADDMGTTFSKMEEKIKTNNNDIIKLQKYLDNGASGKLGKEYREKINAKTNENAKLSEMIAGMTIKPVIGYDEYGNRVFGDFDPEKNVLTYDGYNCIGYDTNKNVVFEYTEEGKCVIGYNKDIYIYGSHLIQPFGMDKDGDMIYGFDVDNMPIYGFTTTKMCVMKKYIAENTSEFYLKDIDIKPYIGKTQTGEPIFDYNEVNIPIIGYDKNGKSILYVFNNREDIKTKYEYYLNKIEEKNEKVKGILQGLVPSEIYGTEVIDFESDNEELTYSLETFNSKYEYYYNNLSRIILDDEVIARLEEIYTSKDELVNLYNNYDEYLELYYSFRRLLEETPKPPVIGINDKNGPIFGELLIETETKGIPELVYSSDSAFDLGFSEPEIKESTSVLNEEDFDLDAQFAKVEKELIANDNGTSNVGQMLTVVVGMTEEE